MLLAEQSLTMKSMATRYTPLLETVLLRLLMGLLRVIYWLWLEAVVVEWDGAELAVEVVAD
jgi:hypothetical protein